MKRTLFILGITSIALIITFHQDISMALKNYATEFAYTVIEHVEGPSEKIRKEKKISEIKDIFSKIVSDGRIWKSGEVKIGDTAILPYSGWIDVISEHAARNKEVRVTREETCVTKRGDGIEVIGKAEDYLLIVRLLDGRDSPGTRCSAGVPFIISEQKFKELTKTYAKSLMGSIATIPKISPKDLKELQKEELDL